MALYWSLLKSFDKNGYCVSATLIGDRLSAHILCPLFIIRWHFLWLHIITFNSLHLNKQFKITEMSFPLYYFKFKTSIGMECGSFNLHNLGIKFQTSIEVSRNFIFYYIYSYIYIYITIYVVEYEIAWHFNWSLKFNS